MKKFKSWLVRGGMVAVAVLLGAGVVLSVFGWPVPVEADDVEVVLSVASYMDSVQDCDDYSNEPTTSLQMWNDYDDSKRCVFRADDQTSGGNVTQVLFKIYYYDWYETFDNPSGEKIRLYRLTKTFDEDYVTAEHRTSSSTWTSCGGDYTTVNYAEATFPSSDGQWIQFDITDMAMDEWEDNDDLYFIMRFRYETGTGESSWHWVFFRGDEYATASYRPRIVVTYEDEEQIPIVEASVDEIGDVYLDIECTYNCFDWTNCAVYAEASLDGAGNYTYVSSGSTGLSGSSSVVETISGLTANTAYDVRAKLVYDSPPETVYSSVLDVTTRDYVVPVWLCDVEDIHTSEATLQAEWTGNTDLKEILARVYYRKDDVPTWTMVEPNKYASTSSGELSWIVEELAGSHHDYYYYAEFQIEGDWYVSSQDTFNTNDGIDWTVETDSDLDSIDITVDVLDMGDWSGHDVDLYAEWDYAGGIFEAIGQTSKQKITGTGEYYISIDELEGTTEYALRVYRDNNTWDEVYHTYISSVWTDDIDDAPEFSDVTSQFIAPYTLRLKADVDLNDAVEYDCELWFEYEIDDEWYATDSIVIDEDGLYYIDLSCWSELDFDTCYYVKAVIDYTVGDVESDELQVCTPEMGYGVATLEPEILSDTQARLRGFVQIAEGDSTSYTYRFVWWKSGDTYKEWTPAEVAGTGVYTYDIGDLVFGESYVYQIYWSHWSQYGEQVTFIAGYTGGSSGSGTGWFQWFDWLTNGLPIGSQVVKMLIGIMVSLGVGAVVAYKLKGRAGQMLALFAVTGFTVVFSAVRWYPVWFIMVVGLVLVIAFLLVFRGGLGQES